MQPQGAAIVNVQYFTNVIKQTQNVITELNYFKNNNFQQEVIQELEQQLQGQLQSLANQIIPDIMTQINAINQTIALLEPMQILATLSIGNLSQVITFLTDFQSLFLEVQIVKPYVNLLSQVSQLATELSTLTSAINTASSTIVASSGGTVPPVQIPGSPQIQQGETVHVAFTVTRA